MIDHLGIAHPDLLSIGEAGKLDLFIIDKRAGETHIFDGKLIAVPRQHGMLGRDIRIGKHDLGFQCRTSDRDRGSTFMNELVENELGAFEFAGGYFEP